ncbi:aspartate-semialdehyde dehydrogenase [bacterium]|nr:aspartate-semialdehyde dehydrogenase [bacterium]
MQNKIPVAVLGATGMVGQRFVSLLSDHPWFEIRIVAASSRSAGRPYADSVHGRWTLREPVPPAVGRLNVLEVEKDMAKIASEARMVFSALAMEKARIAEIENAYAGLDAAVISNNSAHRWTQDVPMLMPEINPHHLDLIGIQRKNRGWKKGLIVVKPNCSIQSYVPVLEAFKPFGPEKVMVCTCQAVSGAGKTLESWPEMVDNVIPFIGGEEKKSEDEPLRIWGTIRNGVIEPAKKPVISATCIRVPVTDGHLASVHVTFGKKPSREDLTDAIRQFENPLAGLKLPSSPGAFIKYFDEEDRPQTRLDRDFERGMGITVGRLREDSILGWKFIALSHNTLRGAAGGSVLTAELVTAKGYAS